MLHTYSFCYSCYIEAKAKTPLVRRLVSSYHTMYLSLLKHNTLILSFPPWFLGRKCITHEKKRLKKKKKEMPRQKSRLNRKNNLKCKTRPLMLGKAEILPVTVLIIKCYGDLSILGDSRNSIDTEMNHPICNHVSHLREQG